VNVANEKVKYPSAVHAGQALALTFAVLGGLFFVGTIAYGVSEAKKRTQRLWRRPA
jgi:hypothetical protein